MKNVWEMATEELRACLGDSARSMPPSAQASVGAGAKAAREALGSDELFQTFLTNLAARVAGGSSQATQTERSAPAHADPPEAPTASVQHETETEEQPARVAPVPQTAAVIDAEERAKRKRFAAFLDYE